ncbi:MAG: hypothetical protein FJX62_05145 [Alphaproteobacteria bacterium]|nr:hypothetical protein [Alphaproteobacteria bacterium]
MARALDREKLLAAFDEIGRAAIVAGTRLSIAVFGGSALMLASNFRFSTEDVDIAEIGQPWPSWLADAVERIASSNDWPVGWLNDAVTFHLSPLASKDRDLTLFGNFPRRSETAGLSVLVPTARYLLALKLKALRISDFDKGALDMSDVANLLKVLGITDVEEAIAVLAAYFPKSASDADKQRFVLKRLLSGAGSHDAPHYPR